MLLCRSIFAGPYQDYVCNYFLLNEKRAQARSRKKITQSKVSLDSSGFLAQGCEVSFVNYFYLTLLISGQSAFLIIVTTNQTRPFPPTAALPSAATIPVSLPLIRSQTAAMSPYI